MGTITLRELNRAYLARQGLLERSGRTPVETVRHLVGLQSQQAQPPYVGLWTRIDRFDPEAASAALERRELVRLRLMRGTVHLVTAADARTLRAFVQPVIDRVFWDVRLPFLGDVERAALTAQVLELFADGVPRTAAQLGAALGERHPGVDPAVLGTVGIDCVPTVQVPPRGLWGRSGTPAWLPLDDWIGPPATDPAEPADLAAEIAVRYLAAFGPAAPKDLQKWCGLTGLGATLRRLDLARFRDENGAELVDLPDAPRPGADVDAPVRFLPDFDNAVLSHVDHSRILDHAHRPRVFTINGQIRGLLLVDGFAVATWKIARTRDAATLTVRPFDRIPAAVRRRIEPEAHALLAVTGTAPDAVPREPARDPRVEYV